MKAHACVVHQYGPPSVLRYETVALPPLGPDEVRIRSVASAVNHTDLEIRAGVWPVQKSSPFPYIPGVEVVGEISEIGAMVSGLRVGDRAITMMQGLGGVRAERTGGYAEYVTVAADNVATVSPEANLCAMAAIGLAGVTAYEGLKRIGILSDRRLLVTGAAGGVGSLGVAIAHAEKAFVIGVVSRAAQVPYVRSLGANEVLVCPRGAKLEIPPHSIDGVLVTAAGDLFADCVAALKPGGTMSLVGAVGGSQVHFDAYELIRPVVLTGYSSETLDGKCMRSAMEVLQQLVVKGLMNAPAYSTFVLQQAADAHAELERGGVSGRILLTP